MKRRLFFRKRLLKLDFAGWREKRKSGAYRRYYIKPVKDERNILAKNLDFLCVIIGASIITAAVNSVYCTNYRQLVIWTIPMVALEILIALRLRRNLDKRAAVHKRLWRAGRQCQENIMETARRGGMDKLLTELLAKMHGFSDIHMVREEESHPCTDGMSIKVRALYQGLPVAVACLSGEGDGKAVSIDKIIRFRNELCRINMDSGIIAAAATFTSAARRAAREGKKRIVLLDIYKLVEMSRITGHPVFPPADKAAPEQKYAGGFMYQRLFSIALARDKTRGYLMAAGVIWAVYFLNDAADGYGAFYIAAGLFNLAMAAYCLVFNRDGDLDGLSGQRLKDQKQI